MPVPEGVVVRMGWWCGTGDGQGEAPGEWTGDK